MCVCMCVWLCASVLLSCDFNFGLIQYFNWIPSCYSPRISNAQYAASNTRGLIGVVVFTLQQLPPQMKIYPTRLRRTGSQTRSGFKLLCYDFFPRFSDCLSTDDRRKCAVTLSKLADFFGFELTWHGTWFVKENKPVQRRWQLLEKSHALWKKCLAVDWTNLFANFNQSDRQYERTATIWAC